MISTRPKREIVIAVVVAAAFLMAGSAWAEVFFAETFEATPIGATPNPSTWQDQGGLIIAEGGISGQYATNAAAGGDKWATHWKDDPLGGGTNYAESGILYAYALMKFGGGGNDRSQLLFARNDVSPWGHAYAKFYPYYDKFQFQEGSGASYKRTVVSTPSSDPNVLAYDEWFAVKCVMDFAANHQKAYYSKGGATQDDWREAWDFPFENPLPFGQANGLGAIQLYVFTATEAGSTCWDNLIFADEDFTPDEVLTYDPTVIFFSETFEDTDVGSPLDPTKWQDQGGLAVAAGGISGRYATNASSGGDMWATHWKDDPLGGGTNYAESGILYGYALMKFDGGEGSDRSQLLFARNDVSPWGHAYSKFYPYNDKFQFQEGSGQSYGMTFASTPSSDPDVLAYDEWFAVKVVMDFAANHQKAYYSKGGDTQGDWRAAWDFPFENPLPFGQANGLGVIQLYVFTATEAGSTCWDNLIFADENLTPNEAGMPEPMTLSLLVLGGLGILRRRKSL